MSGGHQRRVEAAFDEFVRLSKDTPGLDPRAFIEGQDGELRESLSPLIQDFLLLQAQSTALPRASSQAEGEPQHFGEFELLEVLGRGASGLVWRAYQASLARHVALKQLYPVFVLDQRLRSRFELEASAAARLSHEGIVSIFSVGDQGGVPYIVQELIPKGRTLATWIAERSHSGPWGREHYSEVARLAAQVAEALAHAHEHGIIHRDLKQSNVLLTHQGAPKVADFGLARVAGEPSLSKSGDLSGTIAYMAPEQVMGKRREIDVRSDVFSLGVTMYELLTGSRPFAGDTQQQVIEKILREQPADPRSLRSKIPRDLALICLEALRKKPEHRYQTMQALAKDLRSFLAGGPVLAKPPSLLQRVNAMVRSYPRAVAGVAAAVALLTVTLGMLMWVMEERNLAAFEAGFSEALISRSDEFDLSSARRDGAELLRETDVAREKLSGEALTKYLEKVAGVLRREGRTGEATRLFEEALSRRESAGSGAGQAALGTRRRLAWCHVVEMRFEQAARVLQQGLDLAPVGSLLHDLLEAQYCDAMIRGRLEERLLAYHRDGGDPEALLRGLLERLEMERPADLLLAAQTQAILGSYLRFQNRSEEAATVLEQAKRYCARTLALDDPLRMHVIVEWSVARGESRWLPVDWENSAQEFTRVAHAMGERYGPHHAATGRAWFEAGRAHLESGRFISAEADYTKALTIFEGLGEQHLYPLIIRQHLLMLTLISPEVDVDELLAQAEQLQVDIAQALGASHSDAVNALRFIEGVHAFRREPEQQLRVLQEAEAANPPERWVLGTALEEALMTRYSIMILTFEAGRFEQGVERAQDLLRLLRDHGWEGAMSVPVEGMVRITLASEHLRKGQAAAALELLPEAPPTFWRAWVRRGAHSMRAFALLALDREDEARQELEALDSFLQDSPTGGFDLRLIWSLEACQALDQPLIAQRMLDTLDAGLRSLSSRDLETFQADLERLVPIREWLGSD